ncbi:MAG: hypothetical protein ABS936_14785, partial [Exiguobacterium indicum]
DIGRITRTKTTGRPVYQREWHQDGRGSTGLHAAGADGILVGETLMRADDPQVFIREVSGVRV